MDDRFDDEIHALLSAYAAGTLTPEEQKRLFEKSLSNQKLFDALADEEAMRAALDSPLVKQSLTRALEQRDEERKRPPITKLLWAAVASCLLVGIVSVTLWPTKPVVQIAQVQQPVLISENKPAPTSIMLPEQDAPKPAAKRSASSPQPMRERVADQVPAAPAIATPLESVESRTAPPASKEKADDKLVASRFTAAADQLGAATSAIAKTAPLASIGRNNLAVNAPSASHVYAFLVDGDTIKSLSPTDEAKRLFPLGLHSAQAEVWLLVKDTEDPVLERALTGVLPLPTRNWIKLKTNP